MQRIKKSFRKATATRKGKIIVSSILLVILAAIAGGVIYWKAYRKQIIRDTLVDTVRKKSQGLYRLQYDSLGLDEVAGNLTVTNLDLSFDSLKFEQLAKNNDAPPLLLRIKIPAIEVTGVKTPRALLDKEIVGKKIHIVNPVIDIFYTNAGKDSVRNIPTKEVYQQILGDLDLINVETFEVSGAEIVTRTLKTGKEILRIRNTLIRLNDLVIDSASSTDTTRLVFSKQVFLTAGNISWAVPSGLYTCSADSILVNSLSRSAYAKNFYIRPTMSEDAFVKSLRFQDDRFDIALRGIRLQELNMQGLFNEEIMADSVLIGSMNFKIYRDLSIPRDKKNRVGTYPHQVLARVPIPVNVRKLILSGAMIEYKEKNPRTGMAGKVRFHDTYAVISNITNEKQSISRNGVMTASISSRFLDKAPLKVTWKFYLQQPNGKFDIEGDLGAMPFRQASVLTEPMGPAKLEEGELKALSFKLAGHDYGASGRVKMIYDDLKVSILEKEAGEKKLDKKSLASFAANILIKNANPSKKDEEPRVIEIQMERDTNRSVFYLLWKSIFKGIKETAGIKK